MEGTFSGLPDEDGRLVEQLTRSGSCFRRH